MGSVTEQTVTGDNDPEIEPMAYFRHYLYCDKCGSFRIERWIEPADHPRLLRIRERLVTVSAFLLVLTLILATITLVSFAWTVVFGGGLDFDLLALIPTGVSLIALILVMRSSTHIDSKIQYRGAFCGQCNEKYENGSPFFTDLKINPRNYTMEDVPLPRNQAYWVRGENVKK
ncbi:MAG: hypothetical protein QNK37_13020 [Acidobacteriota bacterium]|nr:hypothetical protein [Acidobacteriota bacterium]